MQESDNISPLDGRYKDKTRGVGEHFSEKAFILSFFGGLVFLLVSLVIQYLATNYANRLASLSVTDIILSNTRVYDVATIFTWGAVIVFLVSVIIIFKYINRAPFTIKSAAVFIIIRSIFVTLTHISQFPAHTLITSSFFQDTLFNGIFNGNDLFFSGHTGMPFLIALIYWDKKVVRYLFLAFSGILAVAVLLGHLHYSIDVLSAYFITYTIFHICLFLFKKDWTLAMKS